MRHKLLEDDYRPLSATTEGLDLGSCQPRKSQSLTKELDGSNAPDHFRRERRTVDSFEDLRLNVAQVRGVDRRRKATDVRAHDTHPVLGFP